MLGLVVIGLSMIYGLFVIVVAIRGEAVSGWASAVLVSMILGGVQLISIGVIAQYIGLIFEQVKQRPLYLVRYKQIASQSVPRDEGPVTIPGAAYTHDDWPDLRRLMNPYTFSGGLKAFMMICCACRYGEFTARSDAGCGTGRGAERLTARCGGYVVTWGRISHIAVGAHIGAGCRREVGHSVAPQPLTSFLTEVMTTPVPSAVARLRVSAPADGRAVYPTISEWPCGRVRMRSDLMWLETPAARDLRQPASTPRCTDCGAPGHPLFPFQYAAQGALSS